MQPKLRRDLTSNLLQGTTEPDWSESRSWVVAGQRMVLALLVSLFGFGLFVSINGAVVTSGVVTVEDNYKTVQSLDGGIVAEIRVRNGDLVRAGDVLLTLDKTSDQAELTVVTERSDDFRIQRARLEAERDGRDIFDIPADVVASEGIKKTIEAQRAL
ncbi:MAG: biotin/lipoyl-binding protein, partial [Pseudomonadota bacterium]